MKWTELTIYTSEEGIEPVSGMLISLGIHEFVVENESEIHAFIEDNKDKWDLVDSGVFEQLKNMRTNIKLYIADTQQGYETAAQVKAALCEMKTQDARELYGELSVEALVMQDADWENNWKSYFKSFIIGENIVIKPSWEEYGAKEGEMVVEIDPANSFGSGLHETTQLCILALRQYVKPGDIVLDVGCGSGILSVIAAKFGARKAVGIDIDETALITSANCALANGVSDKTEFFLGDLTDGLDIKADIVVANLFGAVICRLAKDVKRVLKSGGFFISSGIIADSLEDVKSAYIEAGIALTEIRNSGEWYAVCGKV